VSDELQLVEELQRVASLTDLIEAGLPDTRVTLSWGVHKRTDDESSVPYLLVRLDGREVYRSTGRTATEAVINIAEWVLTLALDSDPVGNA